MSSNEKPVNLDMVLRRYRPNQGKSTESESRLDGLLARAKQPKDAGDGAAGKKLQSPLDQLREKFKLELLPEFHRVAERYSHQDVTLKIDAADFMGGGRKICIEIEFGKMGLRLEGVVMPNSIAFSQGRYSESDRAGLAGSGPTLRTADLDTEKFRSFVCDRMAALVQFVVNKR